MSVTLSVLYSISLYPKLPDMNLTPVTADRAQILLLFYKPTSEDPMLNRLVGHFSPPFCHVELAFPERYGARAWECDIFGSSIFQGETVFYKKKTYMRDGYVCLSIEVSRAQQLRVKHFCKQQSDAGVPFNQWAMYGAYIPIFSSDEGTFCSKHITKALQYGGIYATETMDPIRMTPSGIYEFLCDKNIASPIVQVVPARMHRPSEEHARQVRSDIIAMQPHPPAKVVSDADLCVQSMLHPNNRSRTIDQTKRSMLIANMTQVMITRT